MAGGEVALASTPVTGILDLRPPTDSWSPKHMKVSRTAILIALLVVAAAASASGEPPESTPTVEVEAIN